MTKFIYQKTHNEKSLFKNIELHEDPHSEKATYLQIDNDLKSVIDDSIELELNKKLYFKIAFDYDEDFCFKSDFLRSELITNTCFISNTQVNDDYTALYFSTLQNIIHGKVFNEKELMNFHSEQIKELILVSNVEQYNLICKTNSLHTPNVVSALSHKYLCFLFENQSDFYYHDISNVFNDNFMDEDTYTNIYFLKEIFAETSFDVNYCSDILLFSLPEWETPPTYEWLEIYYNLDLDLDDESFLLEFADYADNPYSYIQHLRDSKKYSEDEINNILKAFKKHVVFALKSHKSMLDDEVYISDNQMMYLSYFLDWVSVFDINKEDLISLFELRPLNSRDEFKNIWNNNNNEFLPFFNFEKGDLFDHWIVNLAYGKEQSINVVKNVQYLIDNYADYLKSRDFPSNQLIEDFLLNSCEFNDDFMKSRAKRLSNEMSNYDNPFNFIKMFI